MNDDVRHGLGVYLNAVASHAKHLSEEDRRDLLENLECHIRDALDARVSGEATVGDLEAVLAEMDPPERYAENDASVRPAKRRPPVSSAQPRPAQPRPAPATAGAVWCNVICHMIGAIGILVLLIFVMPRFIVFFDEMDVALPWVTVLSVSLSRAVGRYFYPVLLMAVPAIALDAFIFFCLARYAGKAASRVWTWAIVILQFAVFLLLSGTLLLPLTALMHA